MWSRSMASAPIAEGTETIIRRGDARSSDHDPAVPMRGEVPTKAPG